MTSERPTQGHTQLKGPLHDGEGTAKEKKRWEIRRKRISETSREEAKENVKGPFTGVLCSLVRLLWAQKAVEAEPAHVLPGSQG